VAAAAVAIGHFVEIAFPQYLAWSYENLSLGRVGVVAFFMVSGYVIPLSLERSTFRNFWISRFFRLFPAYWANVAIVFLLTSWGLGRDPEIHGAALIANLLMLQMFFLVPNVVAPAWTLGIELIFYAQSSVLAAVKRLSAGVNVGYIWLGLFVAGGVIGPLAGVQSPPITVPLLLFTASLGHAVYRCERGLISRGRLIAMAIVGSAGVTLTGFVHFVLLTPPPDVTPLGPVQWSFLGYAGSWVVGVAAFAVCFSARGHHFPRPAVALGRISYSLYLVHPAIYGLVILFLPAKSVMATLIYVMGTLAAAAILYLLVEKPSVSLSKKLTHKSKGNTPAAPEGSAPKRSE
jgi:peptidoglycan/LPS O-acetylase OafA/YrhL